MLRSALEQYLPPELVKYTVAPFAEEYWFVYQAFGIITPYMASQGMTLPELHGLSVSAKTLGTAIASIEWYDRGWGYLSPETLYNCILASAMSRPDSFAESEDDTDEDILNRLKDELSTEEGFQHSLELIMEYEQNASKPSLRPIINLMHGVYMQGNWRLLSDEDFWRIAMCYNCDRKKDTYTSALKIMINAQDYAVTELMLNGFWDLNYLRLDVGTVHYDNDGDLLPPVHAEPGKLREIFEDEVRENFNKLN